MKRRLAYLAAIALSVGIVLIPSSASADVFPGLGGQNDPLNYSGCWASGCTPGNFGGYVKGGDGASIGSFFNNPEAYTGTPANTATIETEIGNVEVATNLLPKFRWVPALSTIALGASAFSAGWAIGSILNEHWLHIAGVGLGTTASVPAATTGLTWLYKNPAGTTSSSTNVTPFHNANFNPDYHTAAGWYLYGSNTGCSTTNAPLIVPTGSFGTATPTCWENASQAAFNALGASSAQLVDGGIQTGTPPNYTTGSYIYIPEAAMAKTAVKQDQPWQTYNGQTSSITTAYPTPGGQGDTTTATTTLPTSGDPLMCLGSGSARSCFSLGTSSTIPAGIPPLDTSSTVPAGGTGIDPTDTTTAGIAFNNLLRCISDPAHFNCPTWSGGSITNVGGAKFSMPDVTGKSESDAESAINAYYASNSWTAPAYTIVTLGTAGAVITKPAGAVVTTSPGATTTLASPATTVTLTENPDPLPVVILQPLPWETGSAYAARLGALGIKVSLIPTGSPVSGYGPDEVIAPADVPVGDTTWTDTPGTRVPGGATVTVPVNISTATAPTGDPNTSSGGTVTIPSTNNCTCVIDFSPLQSLDLGSKFPFGMFTYASGIIGDFNVTPQAPDFNLTAQATGVNGHNLSAPYDVNLGDTSANHIGTMLNTYMGYWRDLLSFLLWVGAIWLVATKLLGFHAGGDVTGAMDDGDPLL